MAEDENYFRGYAKGYEEGLEEAWDELIGLTTKGYTSREIQVLAKTKRSGIRQKVAQRKRKISEENGIQLLESIEVKTLASAIEPGHTYMLEDKNLSRTIPVFNEALRSGVRGLCITRTYPFNIKSRFAGNPEFVWLTKTDTQTQGEAPPFEYISPQEFSKLVTKIQRFLKESSGGIVLLEGVEYLIQNNDFTNVLRLLQSLKDQIVVSKSVLLLPMNPSAFEPKNIKAIQCEIGQEI